jgi:hypothetical protein
MNRNNQQENAEITENGRNFSVSSFTSCFNSCLAGNVCFFEWGTTTPASAWCLGFRRRSPSPNPLPLGEDFQGPRVRVAGRLARASRRGDYLKRGEGFSRSQREHRQRLWRVRGNAGKLPPSPRVLKAPPMNQKIQPEQTEVTENGRNISVSSVTSCSNSET